jgi:pyridoxal phosphate enzyme (YggS family)
MFTYIKNNLTELLSEIDETASKAGVAVPKLVCVTKSGTDEELIALASLGISAIGENRPGELKRRGEILTAKGLYPELHEIGTLQSNKAKLVCPISALIHSLDSRSLAKEISKESKKLGRPIDALIEINSGREEQKGGVMPEDAERFLEEVLAFGGINIKGLMTMGPLVDDPEELRSYFRETKKLFDNLNTRYGFGEGATLSMGMSDSFESAIAEGATIVRVGGALFR